MSKECSICCENITGRNKVLKCIHCNKETCQNCSKKYILDSINDARCMHCEKNWNREFLVECFSYSWVSGGYKKYRQEVLYDRQLSMLEETMKTIEERNYLQEKRDEINKIKGSLVPLRKELKQINHCINRIPQDFEHYNCYKYDSAQKCYEYHKSRADYYEKVREYEIKVEPVKRKIDEANRQIMGFREDIELSGFREIRKQNGDKYFGHCPVSDCKGFITSSWKCGICDTKVCKSCKEKIAPDYINDTNLTGKENVKKKKEYREANPHECDPNTLLALKEIKSTSKPCPKCKIPIMRISGCNQMWCIECHVAFSWSTGEIVVTGNIHNPHYFEWKAQHGGAADPIAQVVIDPCNQQVPQDREIEQILGLCKVINRKSLYNKSYSNIPDDIQCQFNQIIRILNHVQGVEIERYDRLANQDMALEYRVRYMKKDITEKQFKQNLQNFEKRREKQQEFGMIFDMFYNTARELFYQNGLMKTHQVKVILGRYYWDKRVVTETRYNPASEENIRKFIKTFEELRVYANSSFKNLKKKYRNKVPEIKYEVNEYSVSTI